MIQYAVAWWARSRWDDGYMQAQVICPSGRFRKLASSLLSSPSVKIFLFFRNANQVYISPCPVPTKGRFAIVTNVRRDAVDALARKTSAHEADGEVVWS